MDDKKTIEGDHEADLKFAENAKGRKIKMRITE